MKEAGEAAGVGEEQERYASAAQDFFPSVYERRKAVRLGSDAQPDGTTGSKVVGSSMEPDTPTKWRSVTSPPTARTPLSLFPQSAWAGWMTDMPKLKISYVPTG